jgi:hypothetical protein
MNEATTTPAATHEHEFVNDGADATGACEYCDEFDAAAIAKPHAKMETFTVLVTEAQADQLEHFLTDTFPIISGSAVLWFATPGVTPEAQELTHTVADPVAAENHLADCPECGDTMNAHISNKVPTWSDDLDAVVCYWCATHADCDECGEKMEFDLLTQRCPDCHTCECGLSFTDEALRNGYLFCAGCGLDHRPTSTSA